jgi:hypothetical protein
MSDPVPPVDEGALRFDRHVALTPISSRLRSA